jgi:hypothetical protein
MRLISESHSDVTGPPSTSSPACSVTPVTHCSCALVRAPPPRTWLPAGLFLWLRSSSVCLHPPLDRPRLASAQPECLARACPCCAQRSSTTHASRASIAKVKSGGCKGRSSGSAWRTASCKIQIQHIALLRRLLLMSKMWHIIKLACSSDKFQVCLPLRTELSLFTFICRTQAVSCTRNTAHARNVGSETYLSQVSLPPTSEPSQPTVYSTRSSSWLSR